jgi:NADPH:quinone reductase-like Zn-dependent oxidoreductase
VLRGVIRIETARTYPLREAGAAQSELESRRTTGSIVLIV